MAAHELRPMGIGDILDVTFRLYRERFFTFLLIALVVYVPYALLASFPTFQMRQSAIVAQEETDDDDADVPFQRSAEDMQTNMVVTLLVWSIGLIVFAIVLLPLCGAAMTLNISASYLGEELTTVQSYARAAPRLLPLLATKILVGLMLVAGFLMLFVPYIIFLLWFAVVEPVVILEGMMGPAAMGRSRELMRGNMGKGILLGIVLLALTVAMSAIIGALTHFVPWPHEAIAVFAQNVLQAVILPIQTAPWILLYYDLRIRKEAFDLQKLSEALGQPITAELVG